MCKDGEIYCLTEYERLILRDANGEIVPLVNGAAMNAAREYLAANGYLTAAWAITEKGKDAIQ